MIDVDSSRVVLFKALGDATRHHIMQVLSHQELAVNELVESLELPQSTVSRHLRVLREAGLINDRREGATVYCRAAVRAGGGDAICAAICRGLKDEPLPVDIADRVERVLKQRRQRSSEFFDQRGQEWDELRRGCFGQEFPLEAVLGLLPDQWTAADLGTGTGYLLPALGRAFARVIAVDHSEAMLARARQRVGAQGLANVDLRRGELEALPIETGQIDLAVAMLVLHHAGEPHRALSEIARALRPGGTLLVVELSEHQDDELRQAMGDLWMGFSPARLSGMVADAGMRTARIMALSGPTGETGRPRKDRPLFALIARNDKTNETRPGSAPPPGKGRRDDGKDRL